MENDLTPDRDRLIEALRLVARTPNGQPLAIAAEDLMGDEALLVGMLDAAIDEIAQHFSVGAGRGKSKRHHVVLGYNAYLTRSGVPGDSLMNFFQRRLRRLAGEMETSLKLTP